jgi:hypothetical protein
MHGPVVGRFVLIFAGTSFAREYVDVGDEHGTKTQPANAHVSPITNVITVEGMFHIH